MVVFQRNQKHNLISKVLSLCIAITFAFSPISTQANTLNQAVLNLPSPGSMLPLSANYDPAIMRGITIDSNNPLQINFLVDRGDDALDGQSLESESIKLIKYFMAGLTISEENLWVNLSPYEKDRIIAEDFGRTEMGRDLLAQDYLLKQLTSSMMYPEEESGKAFWQRVYAQAEEKFGTTDIPMNTFNKIWIVPEDASVYIHDQSVFVIHSHLKVMLEEDYLALEHHTAESQGDDQVFSGITSQIVREVLLPEIEHEVNNGKHFAPLRQIFNSVILANWYKANLKNSLLGHVYIDQAKTLGIATKDKDINQKIYNQYVQAFRQGAYDYIKEGYDPKAQDVMPRKYFSGGAIVSGFAVNTAKEGNQLEDLLDADLVDVAGRLTASAAMAEGNMPGREALEGMRTSILDGDTATAEGYAEQFGISEADARVGLDWLSEVERETDDSELYGVDKYVDPTSGEVTYERVHIPERGLRGAYDMRGHVGYFWTAKRSFYIGLTVGLFFKEHNVDGSINITASHNPGDENGIKWSMRRRRGPESIVLVGGSVRESTPWIKDAVMKGLQAAGVKVYNIGITASPETYHAITVFEEPGVEKVSLTEDQHVMENNNFMRTLDANETQWNYQRQPSESSRDNLDALQGKMVDAPHEIKTAELNGVEAATEDLEEARRADDIEVTNPFVLSHNAWVAARVRLGSEIARALFRKWVEEKDEFPEMMRMLQKVEWPDETDEAFWRNFLSQFELDETKFAQQPRTAIAQPLKLLKSQRFGVDYGNGSNWRKTDLLVELGADMQSVVEDVRVRDAQSATEDISDVEGGTNFPVRIIPGEKPDTFVVVERVDTGRPDGRFPLHMPDPTKPEFQREAIALGEKENRRVVVFDEDGDRITFVDANGVAIDGSLLAILLSQYLKGPILTDVRYPRYSLEAMENDGREGFERKIGETIIRGPVGYAFYIHESIRIQNRLAEIAALQASGEQVPDELYSMTLYDYENFEPEEIDLRKFDGQPVAFGIEPSGHAFVPENGYANDASYLMGVVLSMMLEAEENGTSLEQINDEVDKLPVSPIELRLEMSEDINVAERREYVQEIAQRFREYAAEQGWVDRNEETPEADQWSYEIDNRDGVVIELYNGEGVFVSHALLRNSNNEAVFGLNFEGRDFEEKHRIEDIIFGLIVRESFTLGSGETVWVNMGGGRTSQYIKEDNPEGVERTPDGSEIQHPAPLNRFVQNDTFMSGLSEDAASRLREDAEQVKALAGLTGNARLKMERELLAQREHAAAKKKEGGSAAQVAQVIQNNFTAQYGGIDLNPNNFTTHTSGDQIRYNVPVNLQELERYNVDGFAPVIINITPVVNVPLLLGLEGQNSPIDTSNVESRSSS